MSLFVSARGDYVAIASGNQIAILQKDNDYQEPVGIFTCKIYSFVKNVKFWFRESLLLLCCRSM